MEVKLSSSANDFITPSLACVKPVQIDRTKKNRVLALEGLQDEAAPEAPKVAKVTLNDCLACAGCITSAETVLVEQQSIGEFERMLAAGAYDLIVVSLSTAARAAVAVHLGLGLRETHGRLTHFLKGIGCDRVLDCGVAGYLGLLQTAAEFIYRFRAASAATAASAASAPAPASAPPSASASATASPVAEALPLPLLTSSCPGWVCYAEKTHGEGVLRHLSRVKSPQQIAGTLVKYAYAASCGVPPERVCHVAVMPCFDKKLEASRDDFFNAEAGPQGARDVDCVLSSAELLQLCEQRGAPRLMETLVSPPDADPPLSALHLTPLSAPDAASGGTDSDGDFNVRDVDISDAAGDGYGGDGSDGGGSSSGTVDGSVADVGFGGFSYAAPGASGGHADFVFRCASRELFGIDPPDGPLPWVAGRNNDLQELTLEQNGVCVLRFARAYGFRNIQNIVRRVKSGKSPYHFVELMACPGGCANGGGQPRPPPLEAATRTAAVEAKLVNAAETRRVSPFDQPCVRGLYAEGAFLEGGPLGAACQRHLITGFHAVDPTKQNPLTVSW